MHYAKLVKATNEMQADCLRIIVRAEMRLGDIMDQGRTEGWRPIVRPDEAVVLRVPPQVRRRLEAVAARKRRSVSTYLEELIVGHLAQHETVVVEAQPRLLFA